MRANFSLPGPTNTSIVQPKLPLVPTPRPHGSATAAAISPSSHGCVAPVSPICGAHVTGSPSSSLGAQQNADSVGKLGFCPWPLPLSSRTRGALISLPSGTHLASSSTEWRTPWALRLCTPRCPPPGSGGSRWPFQPPGRNPLAVGY